MGGNGGTKEHLKLYLKFESGIFLLRISGITHMAPICLDECMCEGGEGPTLQ